MNINSTDKQATIHFFDINETEQEKPSTLFLIHGTGASSSTWQSVLQPLKEKYRVVAIDLRGHGDSEAGIDAEYSTETMVSDVEAVMKHLKLDSVVFIGHSVGVRVVVPYSAKHPEQVRGLILEDLHIKPAEKKVLKSEEIDKLKTFKREHASLEDAKAHMREFYKEDKIASCLKDGRIEVREDGSVKIKVHPFVTHLMVDNISASTKTRECFHQIISVPKLLIRADGETSYAKDDGVQEMTNIDPKLKVVKVPNSEHSVHKTNPQEFLELVDTFMKGL